MKSEVTITDIRSITTKVKLYPEQGLITTLSIDAHLQPADIARILNMQKQGAPLNMTIGSEQLMFDLDIAVSQIKL